MGSFTTKFHVNGLKFGAIVTPLDSCRYKIEVVTGDPNPVVLRRTDQEWVVERRGKWNIAEADFQKLGAILDDYLERNSSE